MSPSSQRQKGGDSEAAALAARDCHVLGLDFILGDDWTVAATVTAALVGTWVLTRAGVPAWWLLPVAVISVTAVSLRRAVTRAQRAEQMLMRDR